MTDSCERACGKQRRTDVTDSNMICGACSVFSVCVYTFYTMLQLDRKSALGFLALPALLLLLLLLLLLQRF